MAQAQEGQKPAEPRQLKTANDIRRFVDDLSKSSTQESLPANWRYSIAPFNPPTKIDVEGGGARFVVLKKNPAGEFKPALMKGEDIRTVWEAESAVDFDQKFDDGKSLRDRLIERMGGVDNMNEVLRVADPVFLEMTNKKGPDGTTRISIADLSQRGYFSSPSPEKPDTMVTDPVVTALHEQSGKITDFTMSDKFKILAVTNVPALLLSQLEPRANVPLNVEPVKPAEIKPDAPKSVAAAPVEKRDATPADIERLKLKSIPTDPAAAEDAMYANVKSIVEAHRTMNFTPDQIRVLADQYKPENFYNTPNFQGVNAYKNTLKHIADDPYLLRNDSTINTELNRIDGAHKFHQDGIKSSPEAQAQVQSPPVAPVAVQNTPKIDMDYLAHMRLPESLSTNPYERQTAINRAAFTVFGALKDGSIPEDQKDNLIKQFEKTSPEYVGILNRVRQNPGSVNPAELDAVAIKLTNETVAKSVEGVRISARSDFKAAAGTMYQSIGMGPAALSPEPVIVKINDKKYVLTQEKDLTGGVDYQLRTVQDFVTDHSKRNTVLMESMGKMGDEYSPEKMQRDLETMQINGVVLQTTAEKAASGKVDIDWDKGLNGLDENLKNAVMAAKTRLDNIGGPAIAEPAAEGFESKIKLAVPRV